MTYETFLYDEANGVATITLNRPDVYNALSQTMIKELQSVFKAISRDQSVRAVVLTGAGKGFTSGADLVELSSKIHEISVTEILQNGLHALVSQMKSLEKPIICAINGVAAGAGAIIPLATDYRIMSDQASFVFAAFINIGIVPDSGGTYLLQQLVGAGKAFELLMFADAKNRVTPEQAFDLSLVNRVVAHDDLMSETQTIATKFAQMPTKAIGMTKRALNRAAERNLADALDYEAQLQGAAFKTHDFQEGVAAFIQKRKPEFKGE